MRIVGPGGNLIREDTRFALCDVANQRTSRFVMEVIVELDFVQRIHPRYPPNEPRYENLEGVVALMTSSGSRET